MVGSDRRNARILLEKDLAAAGDRQIVEHVVPLRAIEDHRDRAAALRGRAIVKAQPPEPARAGVRGGRHEVEVVRVGRIPGAVLRTKKGRDATGDAQRFDRRPRRAGDVAEWVQGERRVVRNRRGRRLNRNSCDLNAKQLAVRKPRRLDGICRTDSSLQRRCTPVRRPNPSCRRDRRRRFVSRYPGGRAGFPTRPCRAPAARSWSRPSGARRRDLPGLD